MPDLMDIKYHKFTDAEYIESPNGRGRCEPRFIIMHYTASTTIESAVATFRSTRSQASAHLIIGRDGRLVQMRAFNTVAWHSGPSKYQGFTSLNHHSIGIELVNGGFYRKRGNDYYDWQGKHAFSVSTALSRGYEMEVVRYSKAGSGDLYWMAYTDAQLEMLDRIVPALLKKYQIIDVTGHEDVDTRGWKTDPGPLFPMARYKHLLDDRSDDRPDPSITKGDFGFVTATVLNMRSGPGTDNEIIGQIEQRQTIQIISRLGDWYHVSDRGDFGWVHSAFVRRV